MERLYKVKLPKTPSEDGEIWRSMPSFPRYLVSNKGRVWSTIKGKLLRLLPNSKGYVVCSAFRTNEPQGHAAIHRMVLEAFIGPCPNGFQAAHLNGCPSDNRLENLVWVTSKDNHSHRFLHGTDGMGEKNPRAKLTEDLVRTIRIEATTGINCAVLSRKYGVHQETIRHAIKGISWGWLT
jgi:hypothetical protein